jgi:hypothetical protein
MGWKIYFVALVIFFVWSYIGIFSDRVTAYDYLDIPFTVISMTGLYGYVFKKCFLYSGFWKMFLFIIIIWDFLYNYYSASKVDLSEVGEAAPILLVIAVLVGLCIILPAYIALYLYGFRSKDLWDRERLT